MGYRRSPTRGDSSGSSLAVGSSSRFLIVALIVKRWALEAGFDPALVAGHSLRSGLATAAAEAGKSERSIMKQTSDRSVRVVRRYIRDAELLFPTAPTFVR
jgi:hypothetical protein